MENSLFIYLAVGLEKLAQGSHKYPYPRELQYALNILSQTMLRRGQPYPPTITKVLQLFEHDLNTWWPLDTLPEGIDRDFPLLDEGTLDEQVLEYLGRLALSDEASLQSIQAVVDNELIRKVLDKLRQASYKNAQRAHREYVTVRRFLIEHPRATDSQLRQHLGSLRYVELADIRTMYREAGSLNHKLLHRDKKGNPHYWLCPHCGGVLHWTRGRPRCAKPSVCGRLYPGYQGRQPIKPDTDLWVLKWAIHARTCLPGIREVKLFESLQEIANPYSDQIEVKLWPGVDRYDLQLRFSDEVWAIDVKDYKIPEALADVIANDTLYNAEKSLRWDRGFYVVPFYRTDRHAIYEDYLERVRRNVKDNLQAGIEIVDEAGFMSRLNKKLKGD